MERLILPAIVVVGIVVWSIVIVQYLPATVHWVATGKVIAPE